MTDTEATPTWQARLLRLARTKRFWVALLGGGIALASAISDDARATIVQVAPVVQDIGCGVLDCPDDVDEAMRAALGEALAPWATEAAGDFGNAYIR